MTLIPLWGRLLFLAVVMGTVWVIADRHRAGLDGTEKLAEIGKLQHDFDVRIKAADDALIAANKRAGDKTGTAQSAVTAAVDDYRRDHAAATTFPTMPPRVADLAAGRERVYVAAACRPAANASSDRAVSDHPTAPAGAYGATVYGRAELRPESAGRVGAVGAAADAEVAELRRLVKLGQSYARAAYAACGQQP